MDPHQSRVGRILEALVQAKGTVCTGCLCLAAGMEDVDVAESLESLGQHVYVHVQGYRCVRCGAERAVTYNLYADRPVSEPPRTSRATFQLLQHLLRMRDCVVEVSRNRAPLTAHVSHRTSVIEKSTVRRIETARGHALA